MTAKRLKWCHKPVFGVRCIGWISGVCWWGFTVAVVSISEMQCCCFCSAVPKRVGRASEPILLNNSNNLLNL